MEVQKTDAQVIVCVKDQVAGEKWIEWRVLRHAESVATAPRRRVTYISQTVFFSPHGLPGFLYWYLLYPFHSFKSHLLMQGIVGTVKKLITE
jgi:hypothetical protein